MAINCLRQASHEDAGVCGSSSGQCQRVVGTSVFQMAPRGEGGSRHAPLFSLSTVRLSRAMLPRNTLPRRSWSGVSAGLYTDRRSTKSCRGHTVLPLTAPKEHNALASCIVFGSRPTAASSKKADDEILPNQGGFSDAQAHSMHPNPEALQSCLNLYVMDGTDGRTCLW
jgi:hypothetical protein